jgi:16S rRNA (guanine1207-N2)-methyltransferase
MSRFNNRDAALETLMMALESEPDLLPEEGQIGFLRARPHPVLGDFASRLVCQQNYKKDADALVAAGFKAEEKITGPCSLVLLLPDRQKEQTLADFARAFELLAPGGTLLVSLHNDWGAKRYEKILAEICGEAGTISKHHCRTFWVQKTEEIDNDTLALWKQEGAMQKVVDGRFWSCPGVFSWNRIDEGSQVLVNHLPKDIHGKVADLGAGWGFLSDFLLRNCEDITLLELFEADRTALECARRNMGLAQVKLRPQCHWLDVTQGLDTKTYYDFVVMNPPFHEGRQPDHLLGAKFIATAARSLRVGGHLYMVANRHLPYEQYLDEAFTEWSQVVQEGGFKVLHAIK